MEFEPKILGFLCNWCSYAGADLAGVSRIQYDSNIRVIRVLCSGRVDPVFIIEAFLRKIDGVLVLGCHPGDCHYITGNYEAEIKMKIVSQLLNFIGFADRMRLDWVSASEGFQFGDLVNDFTEQVRKLGPSPIKKEKSNKELIEDLNAIKGALTDTRLRALTGRERKITQERNVYGEIYSSEKFDKLIEDAVYNEFIRHKILQKLSKKSKSIPELSKEIKIDSQEVLQHIVTLRQRGLVDLDEIQEDMPKFISIKL